MSLKNRWLLFFCGWLKPKPHPVTSSRRILIVTTTALGDTLWATPTIESLRKTFPNAYLAALTSPLGYEVLQTNPYLDHIDVLPKSLFFSFFSLKKKIFQQEFDTVLLLHTSQRLVLPICALSGATQIVGTKGLQKGLDRLLTKAVAPKRVHEILRRLDLMQQIGGIIYTETLSFFPKPTTSSLPQGKWIAIHPGSKDPFKRWPERHFIQVGQALQKIGDYRILITGTKQESDLLESIARQIPGAQIHQNQDLHAFANLLQQVELLISNDTGPVHLACALNKPVLAIYGATDPILCGPHKAPHAQTLYEQRPCTPCLKRNCQTPFCLLQIAPQSVIHASIQQLRQNILVHT